MRRGVLAVLVDVSLGCGGLAGPLYKPNALPEGALVLTGGTLWTGEGWSEGTLVLDGERIACAGRCDVPDDAQVIDVSGKELVPGFVDLHVHLGVPTQDGVMGFTDFMMGRPSMHRGFLQHGVTTVRPLCDDVGYAQIMAMRFRQADWAGPRVEAVGPCFTAPNGHLARDLPDDLRAGGVRTPTDEATAREEVRRLQEVGCPGVKVVYDDGGPLDFERMDRAVMAAVVDKARKGGQWVAAHIGSNEELLAVVEAGLTTVEHAPREPLTDEAVQAMKEAGLTFVPTLAVIEALGGEAWLEAGRGSVRKAHTRRGCPSASAPTPRGPTWPSGPAWSASWS